MTSRVYNGVQSVRPSGDPSSVASGLPEESFFEVWNFRWVPDGPIEDNPEPLLITLRAQQIVSYTGGPLVATMQNGDGDVIARAIFDPFIYIEARADEGRFVDSINFPTNFQSSRIILNADDSPISRAVINGENLISVRVKNKAASQSAVRAMDGKQGSVAFNNIGIKTYNVELWGLTAPTNPGGDNDG